jgi:alpha-soluble NSF attachment protein
MGKEVAVVKEKFESYLQFDPNLAGTFENTLIDELCVAVEEFDPDKFAQAVANYDSVHRLDPWKTQMFLRLKESLKEDEDAGL